MNLYNSNQLHIYSPPWNIYNADDHPLYNAIMLIHSTQIEKFWQEFNMQ